MSSLFRIGLYLWDVNLRCKALNDAMLIRMMVVMSWWWWWWWYDGGGDDDGGGGDGDSGNDDDDDDDGGDDDDGYKPDNEECDGDGEVWILYWEVDFICEMYISGVKPLMTKILIILMMIVMMIVMMVIRWIMIKQLKMMIMMTQEWSTFITKNNNWFLLLPLFLHKFKM